MRKWYNYYEEIPFKHLGDDIVTGLDCFNLIKYVYLKERNIEIPYNTKTFLNCKFEDWYHGLVGNPLGNFDNPEYGWEKIAISPKVSELNIFDVAVMSLGSTNYLNHTALYVGDKKILHTMKDINHSRISLYGNYYKEYTERIYRWVGIPK